MLHVEFGMGPINLYPGFLIGIFFKNNQIPQIILLILKLFY